MFRYSPLLRLILIVASGAIGGVQARNIDWFCNPLTTNLTSNDAAMDGTFHFELGTFINGFMPTSANTTQWAANWVAAQRTGYNATNRTFTSRFTIEDNTAPFNVGGAAYVWGFGGAAGSEWILFRATSWTWPTADPINPLALSWNAGSATQVVVGSINVNGALMRSAAVSNSVPPSTSWPQWRADLLNGVAANGGNDDPDGDGISNALEFICGTNPTMPDRLAATTVSTVNSGGQNYLQIGIPRLADRTATLVVEVSTDLVHWSSGPTFTQQVASTSSLWTVRSLTPMNAGAPQQFMRLRVTVVP